MTAVNDGQAALERGRAVMLVSPPAVEHAGAVWELLGREAPGHGPGVSPPGPAALIVCSDSAAAEEWADAAPETLRVHPVTALGRTTRLLTNDAVDILAGTPEDLQALARASALKLESVTTVVLAWPEWLVDAGRLAGLEHVLGETREARRIILAWNPAALNDLVERYARRPHVIGDLPLGDDARPLPAVGPARYAIVPAPRRAAVRNEVLDAIDRARVMTWRRGTTLEPCDVVVCLDLPSRAELAEIAGKAAAVLLLSPAQLPYARSIAAPLTALPFRAARAKAATDAEQLRERVTARLAAGGLEAELALLEPLLERYDAAEIAAALLALRQQVSSVMGPGLTQDSQPTTPSEDTWVKVFVNVGKKDRASAKDLVGALTREVGLARTDIGRIELREGFCLVHLAPHAADAAIRGLSRVAIRGRRVTARRDRET
ncbi:MAG TPA: DbpA RNA binding domain-containing protein [Gemmatimonadales bacterium]|nr:DbpA RNA binding domain-containing protein [Gemmatimonadales bacterium]